MKDMNENSINTKDMDDKYIKELEEMYLSDDAVAEIDSIVARHRRRVRFRSALASAALVLLVVTTGLFLLDSATQSVAASPEITTIELLQTIGTLAGSNLDEIECINATPVKRGIIVKAEFKSGITKTYLMKRGSDGSTIEMTAQK